MTPSQELRLVEEIDRAAVCIRPHVLETPLFHSVYLSELNQGEVYLKLESEQYTGSFKARGALNKVLSLSAEQKANGLVTASTGNHAQGFARALSITGDRGLIYLPENARARQSRSPQALQRRTRLPRHRLPARRTTRQAQAEEKGMVWVSPYNDPMVIAGQGTVGKEILDKQPGIDTVLATIGGGGLISGTAAWMKHHSPETASSAACPKTPRKCTSASRKANPSSLEDPPDTLSDGSAGGSNRAPSPSVCARNWSTTTCCKAKHEIADAIRWMADKHHKIIEGAAGVALGASSMNRRALQAVKRSRSLSAERTSALRYDGDSRS